MWGGGAEFGRMLSFLFGFSVVFPRLLSLLLLAHCSLCSLRFAFSGQSTAWAVASEHPTVFSSYCCQSSKEQSTSTTKLFCLQSSTPCLVCAHCTVQLSPWLAAADEGRVKHQHSADLQAPKFGLSVTPLSFSSLQPLHCLQKAKRAILPRLLHPLSPKRSMPRMQKHSKRAPKAPYDPMAFSTSPQQRVPPVGVHHPRPCRRWHPFFDSPLSSPLPLPRHKHKPPDPFHQQAGLV
ncbi:uncharacterized protein BKA78DRAFT_304870 [Phyllosticta capitalensis]|uniref:uncharacterized protein n=1 Tax=Phyllosticta capitalensis TaxID=121624 RepID=UPI003130D90A